MQPHFYYWFVGLVHIFCIYRVDVTAYRRDATTVYDERHFVTDLRPLNAKADGADWIEAAQIVLHRAPVADERRTFRCWRTHLEGAQWLAREGYQRILEQSCANEE